MAKIKVLLMLLVVLVLSSPLLSIAEVKKEFYPDGKLKSETNYKNDKADGIRRVHYENGKLKSELNYKNGNVISKKEYDEFGKLIN